MRRFLITTLLCAIGPYTFGADTDGDGLLDVIDVAGFDANASGVVGFDRFRIQDLDGANLLADATSLGLGLNQITSGPRCASAASAIRPDNRVGEVVSSGHHFRCVPASDIASLCISQSLRLNALSALF
jgi:hypothetical protein